MTRPSCFLISLDRIGVESFRSQCPSFLHQSDNRLLRRKETKVSKSKTTSDAGSQYRCAQVGRGIQPRSTPLTPLHTQTYLKSIQTITSMNRRTDQRMDGWTDKASYRVACLQLKNLCILLLNASF